MLAFGTIINSVRIETSQSPGLKIKEDEIVDFSSLESYRIKKYKNKLC